VPHTLTVNVLPELPGRGRLGRHQAHDSRNRAYPFPRPAREPVSVLHERRAPILDQNGFSSCTGNMVVGALATDPLYAGLPAKHQPLTEPTALTIYAKATGLDSFPGTFTYPPPAGDDTGSDGGSACEAARTLGLVSGWQWCFGLDHVLAALAGGPVGLGLNWYDSMDEPDSSGLASISPGAQVRGGHEFVARGADVAAHRVRCDNSWGYEWGDKGSFDLGFGDLERLLGESGDAVVPVPAGIPPPAPIDPPDDPEAAYWADPRLALWAARPHRWDNAYAAKQYAALREKRKG
jgi:hypothetical protein